MHYRFPITLTGALAVLLAILPVVISGQNTFTDSLIETQISQFKYKEAIHSIDSIRISLPKSDYTKNLYYNTKLAFSHFRLYNIDSALMYLRTSLAQLKQCQDSNQIISVFKTASYVYNIAGNLDSALVYTNLMLDYARIHKDDLMKRNSLTSLGTILSQNKRFEDALSYHKEAYDLTHTIGDTSNYAIAAYNVGLSYLHLKQADTCFLYLDEAIPFALAENHLNLLFLIYGAYADGSLLANNMSQREFYLLKVQDIALSIGNSQYIAMGACDLAQSALGKNKFKDAIRYAQSADSILSLNPYLVLHARTDSLLYLAYKGNKDYVKSLSYLERYIQKQSQLSSLEQKNALDQVLVKYETTKKDLLIANQQIEIQQKQKVITSFAGALFFLILSFSGITFYWIKRRKFISEIFKKEKYLDSQNEQTREWLQWHLENEKKTHAQEQDNPGSEKPGIPLSQNLLFHELRDAFESQKLYLNPDIHLDAVVKMLGTNKRYLYEALSNSSDDNFRNFVNRYRVNEAKLIIDQKIKSNEPLYIPDIWTNTGFNSRASFYRAFSLITGLTPSEYAKELAKELNLPKK